MTSGQAWYLLGPVTRFQNVGEEVDYEIAQIGLTVRRNSEEVRDIKVYAIDVSMLVRYLAQPLFCK
jgi:hypothetical protein